MWRYAEVSERRYAVLTGALVVQWAAWQLAPHGQGHCQCWGEERCWSPVSPPHRAPGTYTDTLEPWAEDTSFLDHGGGMKKHEWVYCNPIYMNCI